jgi:ubiquinone/menaquinone biosynthesis C-methylase UbiE
VDPLIEFADPRLAAVYDTLNAYDEGAQPDFYLSLAAEIGARSIVDLGCGTGLITCGLASAGFQMVGVDPASALLDQARRRDTSRSVRWINGGAAEIGTPGADLAIMTGHVAQFFLTDESWQDALHLLYEALRPGGRFAFESRNPAAREWESWTTDNVWRGVDPAVGSIVSWSEVADVRDGIVSYSIHHVFDDGADVVSPCELRFRTAQELEHSLANASFSIEQMFGGWDRSQVSPSAPELIVVATRS